MKQGMAVLALVIPAALMVGCAPDNEQIIALVTPVIANKFKDPDSAHFRNLKVVQVNSPALKWYVCGEVNAKNGFGGYVGYERFYGLVEGQEVKYEQLEKVAEKFDLPFLYPDQCKSS